jgi:hypothetical protein
MGITLDEILLIIIIVIGIIFWCWKQTDYHLKYYDEIDKTYHFWWL